MKSVRNIFFLVCMLFIACSDDQNPQRAAYVDFRINLDYPQYHDLTAPGGAMIVTEPVGESYAPNGVIVFRFSLDDFRAFDNRCTHDNAAMNVISSEFKIVCPECGSEYDLMDGFVSKEPAKHNLLRYSTAYDGFSIVQVYNY